MCTIYEYKAVRSIFTLNLFQSFIYIPRAPNPKWKYKCTRECALSVFVVRLNVNGVDENNVTLGGLGD